MQFVSIRRPLIRMFYQYCVHGSNCVDLYKTLSEITSDFSVRLSSFPHTRAKFCDTYLYLRVSAHCLTDREFGTPFHII